MLKTGCHLASPACAVNRSEARSEARPSSARKVGVASWQVPKPVRVGARIGVTFGRPRARGFAFIEGLPWISRDRHLLSHDDPPRFRAVSACPGTSPFPIGHSFWAHLR